MTGRGDNVPAIRTETRIALQTRGVVAAGRSSRPVFGCVYLVWKGRWTRGSVQVGFQIAVKGVEEVVAGTVRADEYVFAIVAEFEAGPAVCLALAVRVREAAFGVEEVERRKGRFVKVSEVVEQDALGWGRGYCDDSCGWVVGCEGCAMEG